MQFDPTVLTPAGAQLALIFGFYLLLMVLVFDLTLTVLHLLEEKE